MFENFTGNIEEMVVDDVPIVKSRASRADYQDHQHLKLHGKIVWKHRIQGGRKEEMRYMKKASRALV